MGDRRVQGQEVIDTGISDRMDNCEGTREHMGAGWLISVIHTSITKGLGMD